jgi:hypothetical protein
MTNVVDLKDCEEEDVKGKTLPAKLPYIMVSAVGEDMFEAKCSAAMLDGYMPLGQWQYVNNMYRQVFILRAKEKNNG